ncbi:hypothetical protein EHM69_09090, partial [candidate division KSB1 bacterium]
MRQNYHFLSHTAVWALLISLFITLAATAAIPNPDSLTVTAVRTSTPPNIDGLLDDAVWQTAVPMDRFTQKDPDEFALPTQNSEVRVLYDDRSIYVGARLYDSAPDSIVGCLVRRDYGIDSD